MFIRRLILISLMLALAFAAAASWGIERVRARDRVVAIERYAASFATELVRARCEANPNWFLAGPREAAPTAARPTPPSPAPPLASPGPAPHPAPSEEPPRTPPAPVGSAEALLAAMLSLCQSRPSLAAPLRAAAVRKDGAALVIEVPPDFLTLATEHADEYRALARKAAGHALPLRIDAGAAAAPVAAAGASPEAARKQKLREEAEKEPAVQEALDLFDGRVVDVREAKPGRGDA